MVSTHSSEAGELAEASRRSEGLLSDRWLTKQNRIPPNPRASLLALPKEILNHISAYLDRTSVIELSRVARSTLFLAEERVWSDLSLLLPRYYAERPLVQPAAYHADPESEYQLWAANTAREAERERQKALRAKMKRIICQGDEGKWERVRKMRLVPRPGSTSWMLNILELASPNLVSLDIEGVYLPLTPQSIFENYGLLEIKMWDAGLHCKALTHLRIGQGAYVHRTLLILLIDAAPELLTLHVEYRAHDVLEEDEDAHFSTADTAPEECTKLVAIHFHAHEDAVNNNAVALSTLSDIIRFSPVLRQLTVRHESSSTRYLGDIMDALADHSSLQDLYWSVSASRFKALLRDDAGRVQAFPPVERLVLRAESWVDEYIHIPDLPDLQHLYFDSSLLEIPATPTLIGAAESPLAQIIPSDFAAQLRASPSLITIHTGNMNVGSGDFGHFDRLRELEQTDEISIIVSSMTPEGSDGGGVLHLQTRPVLQEVGDVAAAQGNTVSGQMTALQYTIPGGEERAKLCVARPAPTWLHYTHCAEWTEPVPLSCIQAMREREGTAPASRGYGRIAVGVDTWGILESARPAPSAAPMDTT